MPKEKCRLLFEEYANPGKKTKVWRVILNNMLLGRIGWWSPWRRYTFFPEPRTLFDASCMQQLVVFITNQMYLRKKKDSDAKRSS